MTVPGRVGRDEGGQARGLATLVPLAAPLLLAARWADVPGPELRVWIVFIGSVVVADVILWLWVWTRERRHEVAEIRRLRQAEARDIARFLAATEPHEGSASDDDQQDSRGARPMPAVAVRTVPGRHRMRLRS